MAGVRAAEHGGGGGRLYLGNPRVAGGMRVWDRKAIAVAELPAQPSMREPKKAAGRQTGLQPLLNPQGYLKVSAVTVATFVFCLEETVQHAHTSCVLKTP